MITFFAQQNPFLVFQLQFIIPENSLNRKSFKRSPHRSLLVTQGCVKHWGNVPRRDAKNVLMGELIKQLMPMATTTRRATIAMMSKKIDTSIIATKNFW